MIFLSVNGCTNSPRLVSGPKRIVSSSKLATTFFTFPEVQRISDSAFASPRLFTYKHTAASGYFSLASLTCSPVSICAIGHSASISGIRTFLSGFSIYAVSAIKSTPQKTMISLSSTSAALLHNSKESPRKSAISWISFGW